jgi:Fe-S-cluster containining protein
VNQSNSTAGDVRLAEAELVQIVDAGMREAVERSGAHLACYRGCAVCCFGPFPITWLDAQRLQRGLTELDSADRDAAAAIRDRARAAVASFADFFPGDVGAGVLPESFDEADFAGHYANVACPALDPDSGACVLYEHRPIACRTYGPPLRLEGEDLPPCPLCFRHASAEEIECARVEVETRTLNAETAVPEGRTLIAYALL